MLSALKIHYSLAQNHSFLFLPLPGLPQNVNAEVTECVIVISSQASGRRYGRNFHATIQEESRQMTNVLIIEDQPNLLRSLVQAIREAGIEATGTASLQQATVLRESPVELVIPDLMLPDGNGLTWLQAVSQRGAFRTGFGCHCDGG